MTKDAEERVGGYILGCITLPICIVTAPLVIKLLARVVAQ
jgi:hypothetical protein